MEKEIKHFVQPDGVLKIFIEGIERELRDYFQLTDEIKTLCYEVQKWATVRYQVVAGRFKPEGWEEEDGDLGGILDAEDGEYRIVSPEETDELLPEFVGLYEQRLAYVESRLLTAQNALFRLLQEQGRKETEKRIGSIVNDVFLLKQYHTPDEDLWYDANERLGMSIADIARQARKSERLSSVSQKGMEKRVERGIAAVRARRIKMDSNYG